MRRLTTEMVHFGIALGLDVYNKDGHLLAKKGLLLEDEMRYRELLDFGYVDGEEPLPEKVEKVPSDRQRLAEVGVLIADDTPLMLDMLEKSLRNLGVERILRAEDGEMALARVGRYRPDLVFLDIDMPRRDGLSALKALRAEFPGLFICMLSAHSSVQNVRTALAAGASGFLVKPFQQARLEAVTKTYLERAAKA
jgi:two-component system chemotaxis response regulator CheY